MLWSTLAIAILLVSLLAWRTRRKLTLFKRIGVPGPKPLPLIGNLADFKDGIYNCHLQWTKKFGKVVGVFYGGRPTIMSTDLEFLEQVLVKQFSNFNNREYTPLRPGLLRNDVISLQGERWKTVRSIMSSSFSKTKLKGMMPLMENNINQLMKNMSERCTDNAITVDMYRELDAVILCIVAQCAYGANLDSQDVPHFSKASKDFFKAFKQGYLPMTLTSILPWLEPLLAWLGCSIHSMTSVKFFQSAVLNIMTKRLEDQGSKREYPDFLSLMTNSLKTETDEVSENNTAKRVLSQDEVLAGCISFFTGNSDTTHAAVSFAIGMLALHPEVQDRLVDEVDKMTEGTDVISFETVDKMTYMDMVIRETLRVYPPVIKCNRTCREECVVKGYRIPKDVGIEVPILVIHRSPEIWPEPEKFDPERFSPENRAKIHPMAFLPFGSGPRKCLGERFARIEISLILSRFLQRFRFERCPETEETIIFGKGGLIFPLNGINIRLRPRSEA